HVASHERRGPSHESPGRGTRPGGARAALPEGRASVSGCETRSGLVASASGGEPSRFALGPNLDPGSGNSRNRTHDAGRGLLSTGIPEKGAVAGVGPAGRI